MKYLQLNEICVMTKPARSLHGRFTLPVCAGVSCAVGEGMDPFSMIRSCIVDASHLSVARDGL